MALTEFPQFNRLAPEMRNMIWRLSILPRIVNVRLDAIFSLQNARRNQGYTPEEETEHWENPHEPDSSRKLDNPTFAWNYSGDRVALPQYVLRSPTTVPLMSVCRESRSLVKPLYSKLYYRGKASSIATPVLFDFEHDTFYSKFENENNESDFGDFNWTRSHPNAHPVISLIGEDSKKIQRIAIATRNGLSLYLKKISWALLSTFTRSRLYMQLITSMRATYLSWIIFIISMPGSGIL
jgi:hypothetical protein